MQQIGSIAVGSNSDNDRVGVDCFNLFSHAYPIHYRHADIRQYQVRPVLPEKLQAPGAVFRDIHGQHGIFGHQRCTDHLPRIGLVFHIQN